MTYEEIMAYRHHQAFAEVKLKGSPVVSPALKVAAVQRTQCPRCGKVHKFFWRLPDDLPQIVRDDPEYPTYTSRRACEATVRREHE